MFRSAFLAYASRRENDFIILSGFIHFCIHNFLYSIENRKNI